MYTAEKQKRTLLKISYYELCVRLRYVCAFVSVYVKVQSSVAQGKGFVFPPAGTIRFRHLPHSSLKRLKSEEKKKYHVYLL